MPRLTAVNRLLRELVARPSINPTFLPGQPELTGEERVAEFLAETARSAGIEVRRQAVLPGRKNLIARISPSGKVRERIMLTPHMDVVPANPETWKRDPFKLTVEGDELHGRGATDCLGHVALITELMLELAIKKPALQRTVTAVLIANEENGLVANIGVDQLMTTGKLDHIKSGPVIWVDCADMHPCLGTAASIVWHLKVKGKLFHSGLPHKGINSLEMANAACARSWHAKGKRKREKEKSEAATDAVY